jgi:hypothetical protein
LAEFDLAGQLVGALLVGNFGGAGRICVFDLVTGKYIDDLRDKAGAALAVPGLWGLQFGNGNWVTALHCRPGQMTKKTACLAVCAT